MNTTHTFIVTVSGCDRKQAAQVLTERLNHDEDYGFNYEVRWESRQGQLVEYEGEATIAVDGVFIELLNEAFWNPGDWYVEALVDGSWVKGQLIDFEREERQVPRVTIHPWDPDTREHTSNETVEIATTEIERLVIP